MDPQAIVVFITAPSQEIGQQIARHLVENKLAACVNIIPSLLSIYSWDKQIQEDREVLLIVKSWMHLFEDQLIPAVKSIHPYQVPEILALPVQAGLPAYLTWMSEVTNENLTGV
jgi:periplasmic divalent cation tolerance protein